MSGEMREYSVHIYYNDDSSKPASLNASGWVAVIQHGGAEIKKFTCCISKRRARRKSRRWIADRVKKTTSVVYTERLGG